VTFSAFVGIALTLAIVLGLLAITLRVVRRMAIGPATGRANLRMEVVRRIPLGPRQGIAVVRIGTQTVAVSVGDGGVRQLLVLEPEDLVDEPLAAQVSPAPRDFRALLREGIRSAGLPIGVTLLVVSLTLMPDSLTAQQPAATPATGAPTRAGQQAPQRPRGGATTITPNAGPLVVPQSVRGVPAQPQASAIAPRPAAVAASATVGGAQAPRPASPAPASAVATTDALLSRAAPQLDLKLGNDTEKGLHLSGTVGVVVMMGLLTLLPTLLLMMTSFTRILIVLHFLKQALGTQSAPPAHLVSALALLLTGFVMAPTLSEVNRDALTPWLDGKIEQVEMMKTAVGPFRSFMLRQTRDRDIEAFVDMSKAEPPKTAEEVPTVVLMSAFVTSELRTAFQLGFALFLPFIIIDVVVSSVLMSMGMFMLPPAMISLPFKLLLFVLVDGWTLVVQSLVAGFK
jgi:flagellar biosynthetic protein FliP